MALITKLNVVNRALGLLGQRGVNDLTSPHPSIPDALERLDLCNKTVQTRRYWFNTEYPTLVPLTDGRILLPNNTLSVDAVDESTSYTQRGRYLYNTATSSYTFTGPVAVRLHRLVDFEDLPPTAARYVMTQTLLLYVADLDGDTARVNALYREDGVAFQGLTAEDTRNAKVNIMRRPGVRVGRYRVNQDSPYPYRR